MDSGDRRPAGDAWLVPPGTSVLRTVLAPAGAGGFETMACVVQSFVCSFVRSFIHSCIHWIVLNAYYVLGPMQSLGGVGME